MGGSRRPSHIFLKIYFATPVTVNASGVSAEKATFCFPVAAATPVPAPAPTPAPIAAPFPPPASAPINAPAAAPPPILVALLFVWLLPLRLRAVDVTAWPSTEVSRIV